MKPKTDKKKEKTFDTVKTFRAIKEKIFLLTQTLYRNYTDLTETLYRPKGLPKRSILVTNTLPSSKGKHGDRQQTP